MEYVGVITHLQIFYYITSWDIQLGKYPLVKEPNRGIFIWLVSIPIESEVFISWLVVGTGRRSNMSSFDIPQPMTTGRFPQDLQNRCEKFVQVNITLPKTNVNVAPEKMVVGKGLSLFWRPTFRGPCEFLWAIHVSKIRSNCPAILRLWAFLGWWKPDPKSMIVEDLRLVTRE